MSNNLQLTDKVGKFSGNRYLKEKDGDQRLLEERDYDTPDMFDMWYNEVRNDEDFKEEVLGIVQGWKDMIPEGIDPSNVTLYMVGQSHIDMAWKWRYAQTRRKGLKTMQKVVRHAELFPGAFMYALSQPCLVEWIKEDDPELYTKIKELHQKGVIELVGGSWVEPDCMMPSGEAFVRQRLYGMLFYKNEFNDLPEVEWFLSREQLKEVDYDWGKSANFF